MQGNCEKQVTAVMREEQKNFSKRDYKGLERLKRFRKKA